MSQGYISVASRDDDLLLTLTGKASVEVAAEVQKALLAADPKKALAINWKDSEHVESCVLQVLLAFKQNKGGAERRVTVENDSTHIREYLTFAGLSEYFPVTTNSQSSSETINA